VNALRCSDKAATMTLRDVKRRPAKPDGDHDIDATSTASEDNAQSIDVATIELTS
jgi:hypothetical protein